MRGLNVAIAGATGAVGEELIKLLSERNFPVNSLRLLASARSAGKVMDTPFGEIAVEETTKDSFKGVELAFFSAGAGVSKEYAKSAVESGVVVIDNTSAFRMEPGIPLVVPEVNPEDIKRHKGIIANPNCSTTIMVVALKPLHDYGRIKRVVVSTYQAVSGAGAKGMTALEDESRAYLEGESVEAKLLPVSSAPKHYQIAFNLLPQIDVFQEMDYTKEEWKMVKETQKIMGDDSIRVTATTIRVPVFRSHSESINIETEAKITAEKARELLSAAPGVVVLDNPKEQEYPMPLYTSGRDPVYVGRIREDNSIDNGLNIWVVGDQIRKGAALNSIQIAEWMIVNDLL